MSDNPFESPETSETLAPQELEHAELVAIAKYQRGLSLCILCYVFTLVLVGVFPEQLRIIWQIGILLVMLVGVCCVALLAMRLYGNIVGVLLAMTVLFPCVGLVVLLVVNSRATSTLRQAGVRVGFLGASEKEIEKLNRG